MKPFLKMVCFCLIACCPILGQLYQAGGLIFEKSPAWTNAQYAENCTPSYFGGTTCLVQDASGVSTFYEQGIDGSFTKWCSDADPPIATTGQKILTWFQHVTGPKGLYFLTTVSATSGARAATWLCTPQGQLSLLLAEDQPISVSLLNGQALTTTLTSPGLVTEDSHGRLLLQTGIPSGPLLVSAQGVFQVTSSGLVQLATEPPTDTLQIGSQLVVADKDGGFTAGAAIPPSLGAPGVLSVVRYKNATGSAYRTILLAPGETVNGETVSTIVSMTQDFLAGGMDVVYTNSTGGYRAATVIDGVINVVAKADLAPLPPGIQFGSYTQPYFPIWVGSGSGMMELIGNGQTLSFYQGRKWPDGSMFQEGTSGAFGCGCGVSFITTTGTWLITVPVVTAPTGTIDTGSTVTLTGNNLSFPGLTTSVVDQNGVVYPVTINANGSASFTAPSAAGSYTMTVMVGNAASSTFTLTVTAAPISISATELAFSNAVTTALAANTWYELYGTSLAPVPDSPALTSSGTFPTTDQGVSVTLTVNSAAYPSAINYDSPGQINFLTPTNLPTTGAAVLTVNNNGQTATASFTLSDITPALLKDSSGDTVAQLPDGTLASISNPLTSGTPFTLYAVGLGSTTVNPESDLSYTALLPTLNIGQAQCAISYSGLVPGAFGLYQINATCGQLPNQAQPGPAQGSFEIGNDTLPVVIIVK